MVARSGNFPTKGFESADYVGRAENWKTSHQAITSIWRVSTVKGNPRSARTSKHARIASRMFVRATSLVSPWLTHPGMAGHSTTHAPSSSRSMFTRNFMNKPSRTDPNGIPGRNRNLVQCITVEYKPPAPSRTKHRSGSLALALHRGARSSNTARRCGRTQKNRCSLLRAVRFDGFRVDWPRGAGSTIPVELNCSSGPMGYQHFARGLLRRLSSLHSPPQVNSLAIFILIVFLNLDCGGLTPPSFVSGVFEKQTKSKRRYIATLQIEGR